jgi:hypothetical protein
VEAEASLDQPGSSQGQEAAHKDVAFCNRAMGKFFRSMGLTHRLWLPTKGSSGGRELKNCIFPVACSFSLMNGDIVPIISVLKNCCPPGKQGENQVCDDQFYDNNNVQKHKHQSVETEKKVLLLIVLSPWKTKTSP